MVQRWNWAYVKWRARRALSVNWLHQHGLHKSNSLSILLASDEIRDPSECTLSRQAACYRQASNNYNMAISNDSATARNLSSRANPIQPSLSNKSKPNLLLFLYLAPTQHNWEPRNSHDKPKNNTTILHQCNAHGKSCIFMHNWMNGASTIYNSRQLRSSASKAPLAESNE